MGRWSLREVEDCTSLLPEFCSLDWMLRFFRERAPERDRRVRIGGNEDVDDLGGFGADPSSVELV
jgi:hypothetical protein